MNRLKQWFVFGVYSHCVQFSRNCWQDKQKSINCYHSSFYLNIVFQFQVSFFLLEPPDTDWTICIETTELNGGKRRKENMQRLNCFFKMSAVMVHVRPKIKTIFRLHSGNEWERNFFFHRPWLVEKRFFSLIHRSFYFSNKRKCLNLKRCLFSMASTDFSHFRSFTVKNRINKQKNRSK